MKTAFRVDRFRRSVLLGEPGEYDGRPQLPERIVDLVPQRTNRFRESLASALPFLNQVNGALESPRPMYPLTASILREYAVPFEALATNVEWAPTDIPSGTGSLIVRLSDSIADVSERCAPDEYELLLLRSDRYNGSISTTTSTAAASNAWLAGTLDGTEALALTLVAIGVMFAEDFDARSIVVRGVERPNRIEILERLTESVGLRLAFEGEHDAPRN